jgi:hypothetical protein
MMWTDTELDQALADQPAGPAFSPEARARALAKLREADAAPLAEVTPLRRRHRGRWIAAAAAAVAVVGGTAVFASGGPVPAVSAAAVLDQAANSTADASVGPGQYLYNRWDTWTLFHSRDNSPYQLQGQFERVSEIWQPANVADEWMLKADPTGRHTWVVGNDAQLKAVGGSKALVPATISTDGYGSINERARCGQFPSDTLAGNACDHGPGDWSNPTAGFVASLPRDPKQLYENLRDYSHNAEPGPLEYAAKLFESGLADKELRSALYRALMLVPGLEVTDQALDLDGQRGVALSIVQFNQRLDFVVDPTAGRYIGERLVQVEHGNVPPGTVMWSASVRTSVVDKIGVAPQ